MGKRVKDNPKQDYKFEVDLYPSSTSYDFAEAVSKLQDYFEMWAWCIHDKDWDSEGKLKEAHCHFMGRTANNSYVSAQTVANVCGVPVNHVEFIRKFKPAMRYLVHADDPDKAQYASSAVTANFDYENFCGLRKDSDHAKRIIRHIIDNHVVSYTELASWCLENGCWSEFRRAYSVWKDIMYEISLKPIDTLPQQFTQDNNNSQIEMDGLYKPPNGFDPNGKR